MDDLSKNTRILIVDDEENARILLADLINELEGFEIIGSVDSVDNAFNVILNKKPDAVLLDIQMPRKDGFELIEMLNRIDSYPEIIFVTAYEEFTIKAIRSAAFDYLMKPINKYELAESLTRLKRKKLNEHKESAFKNLLDKLSNKKKIRFNDRVGFNLLDPDNIVYIKAAGNYCEFKMTNGQTMLISQNLGKVEPELQGLHFIRISRSCIINSDFLVRVDRKKMICELSNNEIYECKLSKNYIREIEDLY